MARRYQVFVSSTYEDLHEERREVMQALLALDCIPTGMELFPAADDDSWTIIQRFIEECDYYVVIVGGRYGSRGPAGKSFTEMEYDHAVQAGLPVLAFLHKGPVIAVSESETTEDGTLLGAFRAKIEAARHAKYWSSAAELAKVVTQGMYSLMRSKPRVGWVRSDSVPEGAKDELLRLRKEIDSLNEELATVKSKSAPEGVEDLAQGAETTRVTIELESNEWGPQTFSLDVRWDSLMQAVLPQSFGGGATPEAVANAVASLAQREALARHLPDAKGLSWQHSIACRSDYGKITNQMVALGLIEARPDPMNRVFTRWFATPYGVATGTRLFAVKRAQPVEAPYPRSAPSTPTRQRSQNEVVRMSRRSTLLLDAITQVQSSQWRRPKVWPSSCTASLVSRSSSSS